MTTEMIRVKRRTYLAQRAELAELAEAEEDGDVKDAERYYDAREDCAGAEAELYALALRAIAKGHSDSRYVAELALGDHDTDGGLL